MLSKKFRLPIQTVFQHKAQKIIRSPSFLLKIFSPQLDYSRFGVIVGAKVSKRAVARNRIKREIFNLLKDGKDKLPIADYLFIALPSATQLSKKGFADELNNVLSRKLSVVSCQS